MKKCPFCSSAIEEDTLLYGGSCSKCFGEIPGEEAATDPGEVVRAKEAASDNRRMAFKALIPVVFAVPLVAMLGVTTLGLVWWNQDPVAEVLTFDDEDFITFDGDGIVAVDPDLLEEPSNQKPGPQTPKPGSDRPRPNPGGTPDAPKPDPQPDAAPSSQPKPSGAGWGGFGDAPDVQARRTGEALSDPGQIMKMIKDVMKSRQGTLGQCYNKRLKVKEDLQGRWRAYYTVGKNGYAKNVRFQGRETQDSELEACLAREVAKWKFSPITKSQPVEKTWTFKR